MWSAVCVIATIPFRFRGWKSRKDISLFTRTWARGIAKIVNLSVKTYGVIPCSTAGLVISNHLGYMDIITHGTIFPSRFAPSVEVTKMPIVGMIVRASSPVVVNRRSAATSKQAARDFAKTMRRGMYLVVYPEGTSTDGKGGILPFKSTPFEAAAAADLPVLPVLTRYVEKEGDPTVCWYGDMTFLPHFWRVLGLRSIEAELYFLPPVFPEGRSRKALSSAVHDVMAAEYRKILSSEKAQGTKGSGDVSLGDTPQI